MSRRFQWECLIEYTTKFDAHTHTHINMNSWSAGEIKMNQFNVECANLNEKTHYFKVNVKQQL